ncbi:nuclear transport factor 2 family protein [Actinocorallia populi]|uniref:nuclear transport factor 2 family protein n=1 Tax=Actinocorallia populi TaxID=2079200 RepID=UPI000D08C2D5|nr:nuclear transport factor 2 family protein [Actinocorallia populi]
MDADRQGGAVADELEIRNVLARIAQGSDAGGLADYGELFTEDARWEMPGVPVKNGRAEIVAAGAARRAEGVTGPGSRSRHLISTVAVSVAGDRAVAESYWQFFTDTTTTPTLRSMGAYRDTFRRTEHGWRLAERLITPG